MTIRSPILRTLVQSSFRFAVGLAAALLLLWIALLGFNAIVANPYLIAGFWMIGMGGLLACTGACINTFPAADQDRSVAHPVRALLCLAGGATIALVLWVQARPALEGEPLGMGLFGALMAGAVILGMVLILLLSLVLLSEAEEEEGRDAADTSGTIVIDRTVAEWAA